MSTQHSMNKRIIKGYQVKAGKIIKKRDEENLIKTNLVEDASEFNIVESSVYKQAEILIDQIRNGIYTIGNISYTNKIILFKYLTKYNHIVSRIVELHTKLPLSTIRLQKPSQVRNDVVQDYVMHKFSRIFGSYSFQESLEQIVRHYWTYGIGAIQIQDDFDFDKDTLIDINNLENFVKTQEDEEEAKEVEDITKRYNNGTNTISFEDRCKVLNFYFQEVNRDYKGLVNCKVISPFLVAQRSTNVDIDYYQYSVPVNQELLQVLRNLTRLVDFDTQEHIPDKEIEELLVELGYSKAIIALHKRYLQEPTQTGYLPVDSDPFNGDSVYITTLEKKGDNDIDNSLINGILEQAIDMLVAHRKNYKKADLANKKTDLFTMGENSGPEEISHFESELMNASEAEEGYSIVTNLNVSHEEIRMSVKDQIDLDTQIDNDIKDITVGLGMPESLLGGEDTYGSQFMKVELLTNEYVFFRNIFKRFVEEKIFKPMAIKWGFIVKNEWGEPIPVYPTIKFDRISIARSSEDFQIIRELVNDKKLPVKQILEAMGYDYEDVQSVLRQEKVSIFSESVSQALGDATSEMVSRIKGDPKFLDAIREALQMDLNNIDPVSEEDGFGGSISSQNTNTKSKGTYVERRVENGAEILQWLKSQGISTDIDEDQFHVTIAYSRETFKHSVNNKKIQMTSKQYKSIDFLGEDGTLVLHLQSKLLNRDFNKCIEEGASYDYESYRPHITVSYNAQGVDLKSIELPDFDIILGKEMVSELDLDWKENNNL